MIDPDEAESAPEPLRRMMDSAGVRAGASREDFIQGLERSRAAMFGSDPEREARERTYREDRSREERDRFPREDRPREDRSRSTAPAKPLYTPSAKPKITLRLPEKYLELDSDGDGQIGLYEWRLNAGGSLAEFQNLDRNGDGFLTPRELTPPEAASHTNKAASFGNGGSQPAISSEERQLAEGYFERLDTNRDGRITSDEWNVSRRLKPMFEAARIPIDRPMSREEFVSNYFKASRQ